MVKKILDYHQMPPKKPCDCCRGLFRYENYPKHLMTEHKDDIVRQLRLNYGEFHSPPQRLEFSLSTDDKNINYVCACCQNVFLTQKSYYDHYEQSEKCKNINRNERGLLMEQYTGITFSNLHIGKQPSIPTIPTAPATQSKSDMSVYEAKIEALEKQIAELLAWKNSIIAAAPPTNDIVEAPPAAVIEHALIADLSGNALKRTMSEPNMAPATERRVVFSDMTELPKEQQMPLLTVRQQQVAAEKASREAKLAAMKSVAIPTENKPKCIHCDVQDDANYVSCAKCQKPMHFRNDHGYCSGKLRMCAHEDCEDAQFCEKCASKILGDVNEDEDDLCARHRA